MYNNIIIAIIFFSLGYLFHFLISKIKNENSALYLLLKDFKASIDEYKIQNEINTKEVKDAIKTSSELVKILTTNQNLKGQYGEDCLENILKAIYPQENIDYIKQFETQNEDNKSIRPDYLVKLPNNKSILIDCKLNLEKYIEFKESSDEIKFQKKNEFIKDLNSTINTLSNKKYEKAKNLIQANFILMYIPLEPVLTHIYTDKDFLSVIKNASEKNIIIVGNSSILTTIKLTKLLWAQDTQEKNIENIINISQNIYELIAQHSQNLYKIKEQMETNLELFNKEYKKMTQENKIFKSASQLKEFGIKPLNIKNGKKISEINIHSDFLN